MALGEYVEFTAPENITSRTILPGHELFDIQNRIPRCKVIGIYLGNAKMVRKDFIFDQGKGVVTERWLLSARLRIVHSGEFVGRDDEPNKV